MRTVYLRYANAATGLSLGDFQRQHIPRVGDHVVLPHHTNAWVIVSVVWREDEEENLIDISVLEDEAVAETYPTPAQPTIN